MPFRIIAALVLLFSLGAIERVEAEYWGTQNEQQRAELMMQDICIPEYVDTTYYAFWHTRLRNWPAKGDSLPRRGVFFYGGIAYNSFQKPDYCCPTRFVWSFWPVNPGNLDVVPLHAQPGLVPSNRVGEGAAAKIGGAAPYRAGQWYRHLMRVWEPADEQAARHKVYIARWAKPLDGHSEWILRGVMEVPIPHARFVRNPQGGFIEKFGVGEGIRSQSMRNLYTYADGEWSTARVAGIATKGEEHQRISVDAARKSYTYEFYRQPFQGAVAKVREDAEYVDLGTAATPELDELGIGELKAFRKDNDLYVEWQLAKGSAPQLAATVSVRNAAGAELRQHVDLPHENAVLISLPATLRDDVSVELTLADPFDRSVSLTADSVSSLPTGRIFKAVAIDAPVQGLKCSYYELPDALRKNPDEREWANWESRPEMSRMELARTAFQRSPHLGLQTREYGIAVEMESWLNIPESGIYRFFLTATDGGRLEIDGREVLLQSMPFSATPVSTWLYMEKGAHRFRMQVYRDHADKQINPFALELEWQRPGQARQSPPAQAWTLPADRYPTVTAEIDSSIGRDDESNMATFCLSDPQTLDTRISRVDIVSADGEVWGALSRQRPEFEVMLPEGEREMIPRIFLEDGTVVEKPSFALSTSNPQARYWKLAEPVRPVSKRNLAYRIEAERITLMGDQERWAYREVEGDFSFEMQVASMKNVLGKTSRDSSVIVGFRAAADLERNRWSKGYLWKYDRYFNGRYELPGGANDGLRDSSWRDSFHRIQLPCRFRFQREGDRFRAWVKCPQDDDWRLLWDDSYELPEKLYVGPWTYQNVHNGPGRLYRIDFDRIRLTDRP